MADSYQNAVLDYYKKKKEELSLSHNLLNPTRGSVREECIKVFKERFEERDAEVFKNFFEPKSDSSAYLQCIELSRAEKFRTLHNFINKREPGNTSNKNIELLAWLIDFNPRPKLLYDNPSLPQPPGGEGESPLPPPAPPVSIKSVVIIGILLLFIIEASFFLWERGFYRGPKTPSADEKCMYWTGTYYEPIKCDAKIKGAMIIPIDNRLVNSFKKINLPDTLTRNSIGKVWYMGVGKNHEYFTDSGMHPVDTLKRLRPLSLHILNKYISYHRYILNQIYWLACVITFIALCGFFVVYFSKKSKSRTT